MEETATAKSANDAYQKAVSAADAADTALLTADVEIEQIGNIGEEQAMQGLLKLEAAVDNCEKLVDEAAASAAYNKIF
jgi:hypothetical protein